MQIQNQIQIKIQTQLFIQKITNFCYIFIIDKEITKFFYIIEMKEDFAQQFQLALFSNTKKGFKKCPQDRLRYSTLLEWITKRLKFSQNLCEQKQISNEQKIEQDKEVCLSCLKELSQITSFECIDKGNILKLCLDNIIQIINFLNRNFQTKIQQILNQAIDKQQAMQLRYIDRIEGLQVQLKQNKKINGNKWKSFYMMVKDNRILRRQNGKLQRRLKQECVKVKNLQQKIIKFQKQLQKDRILLASDQCSFENIEKFIKNRRSLNKLQKIIDKYPAKVAKLLKNEMQKLQIVELNNLDQKIDFIAKAINDVQDIYAQYQDYEDQQIDRRYLFNVSTQTQLDIYQIGVNTNVLTLINSSTNTRISNLKFFRNVVFFSFDPQFNIKIKEKRRTINAFQQVIQQEPYRNMKNSKKTLQKSYSNSGTSFFRQDNPRLSRQTSKVSRVGNSINQGSRFQRSSQNISNEGYQSFLGNQTFRKNQQQPIKIQKNVFSYIIYPSTTLLLFQTMDFLKAAKQNSVEFNRNSERVILKSHYYKNSLKMKNQNKEDKDSERNKQYHYLKVQNQVYDYSINSLGNQSANLLSTSGMKRGSKFQYIFPNRKSIMGNNGLGLDYTKEDQSFSNLIQNIKNSQKSISSSSISQNQIQKNGLKKIANVKTQANQPEHTKMKKVGTRKSTLKNASNKEIPQQIKERDIQTRQKNNETQRLSKQGQNVRRSVRRYTHTPQLSKFSKIHRQRTEVEQVVTRTSETSKFKKRASKQFLQHKQIENQLRNLSSRETARVNNSNKIIIEASTLKEQIEFPKDSIFPFKKCQSKVDFQSNRANQFKRYDARPGQFQKTIKKIIKSLLQRKNQLINSSMTMKQFLKSQFQFLYGPKNSLQSFLTTIGDIKYQKFSMIMSFQIMLSLNSSQFYLQDLFKLYIIMIQKAANSDVFNIQKERAYQIIEHLFLKFLDPSRVQEFKNAIPCWIDDRLDLHDCFIPITLFMEEYSIKSELYTFLADILPPNQGDLSYEQICELIGVFKGKSDYSQHLFRLKIKTKNERIPYHRLCLYCHNKNWNELLNIDTYIQKKFHQSSQQFNYQDSIKKFRKKPLKNFPWIKSLIDQMADNYFLYGKPVRRTFLQYLHVLELNTIIQNELPFSEKLQFIGNCFTKIVLKTEFTSVVS